MTYQHSDKVIEAARTLYECLIEDAPFGNAEKAVEWVDAAYPQVRMLAFQQTEDEELYDAMSA